MLQVLLNAAVTVGECPLDKLIKAWLQFCLDQSIAVFTFYILKSQSLLFQVISCKATSGLTSNDSDLVKELHFAVVIYTVFWLADLDILVFTDALTRNNVPSYHDICSNQLAK